MIIREKEQLRPAKPRPDPVKKTVKPSKIRSTRPLANDNRLATRRGVSKRPLAVDWRPRGHPSREPILKQRRPFSRR